MEEYKRISGKEAEEKTALLKAFLEDTFGAEIEGFMIGVLHKKGDSMAIAMNGTEKALSKMAVGIGEKMEEEHPGYKEKLAFSELLNDLMKGFH